MVAHHDFGIKGLNIDLLKQIIQIIKNKGINIYISSEIDLTGELEKYSLKITPSEIHHFLAFSKIFISDSQSMSVEAAVLGVPSLRFSDFAGRISVLEELEKKYQLTFGIPTSKPDLLIEKLEELLNKRDLKEEWKIRKNRMLSEKIDVSAFMTWFIDQYPESVKIMKENPDYQYNFK